MKTNSLLPQRPVPPLETEAVDPSGPVNIDELEVRAKAARKRLLEAVDALDQKRHQLTNPSKVVAAGVVPALLVTSALVAGGSMIAFAVSKRRKRSVLSRLVPREPSMLSQVARHVGLTVITFALSEVGKVAVKKLIPSKAEIDAQKTKAQRP